MAAITGRPEFPSRPSKLRAIKIAAQLTQRQIPSAPVSCNGVADIVHKGPYIMQRTADIVHGPSYIL